MSHRYAIALLLAAALSAAPAASAPTPVPPAPQFDAKAWILVDRHSGRVIASKNADARLEPASLTKLMTGYAVFHALKSGKLSLQTAVPISEFAWRAEGSRTFVEVGTRVPVEALIQGMIVQSGNDATIALAEAVAGTEPTFAALMNQYAQRLGMTNSNFENASGLPGAKHYVSTRDMATLARAIIAEFPEHYRWYSQRQFTWGGITQGNRNGLLDRDPSVDGMKTGHTASAGYCLVSSAQRDGMRLIAVVMGAKGFKQREDASLALLNYGFSFFETRRVQPAGRALVTARVYGAEGGEAELGLREDLYVTVPRGAAGNVTVTTVVKPGLEAPLKAGQPVGSVRALLDGKVVAERPLVALREAPEGGLFRRLWDGVASWFG